jgi:hypothetical protein
MFVNLTSEEKDRSKTKQELAKYNYLLGKYGAREFGIYGAFTHDV